MAQSETAEKQTEAPETPDAAEIDIGPDAQAAPQTPIEEPPFEEAAPASETGETAETAVETPEGTALGTGGDARIAGLEAELLEMKDKALRALAEAENVRNRSVREVAQAGNRAITSFARNLLPVADNLSRALTSVPVEARDKDETVKNLIVGIEMTEKELLSALEKAGLKKIDPLGERFDSKVHEAMFEIPDPSQPSGMVGQVIEAGFTLGDLLVRPAKVGVTKGGPKPEAGPQAEETPEAAAGQQTQQKAYAQEAADQGGKLDQEL